MATLHFITVGREFQVSCQPQETLLEVLRRNDIPPHGILLLDKNRNFVSITYRVREKDEVWAYSLRNTDFSYLMPTYTLYEATNPAAEIIEREGTLSQRRITQLSRPDALDRIYASVQDVISSYCNKQDVSAPIQIALSPGGDGRVLAECISRFSNEHADINFHCVITAVGFEDEYEHLSHGIKLAERFELPYTALGVKEAAQLLGYSKDLREISELYKSEFRYDEPEILLTYWVQEVNFAIARATGRRAIVMGYNQEDVIAERLYAMLAGCDSEPFPIRRLGDFDILAPLARIPKRLLDAMDIENSIRNYRLRITPVGYLRSALYFLAYQISEKLPALAEIFSGDVLAVGEDEAVFKWLKLYQVKGGEL